jgi:hypothetical protein
VVGPVVVLVPLVVVAEAGSISTMETVLVESTSQAVICSVMEMVEVRNGAQGPRVADVVPLAEHPDKITLVMVVREEGNQPHTRRQS